MENVKELYGIEPMSFEDEMNLWRWHEHKAQTRNNKRRMVIAMNKLIKDANYMINYAKSIPEVDDEKHASLVEELTQCFESIERKLGNDFTRIVYGKE